MLFQRKVLCLCLNPGYDSTSKVYNWVPIRRQMYFTQIPTHLQRMQLEFCDLCPNLHVCALYYKYKKVKKNIEIEVISRRIL